MLVFTIASCFPAQTSGARIVILNVFEDTAREIFCIVSFEFHLSVLITGYKRYYNISSNYVFGIVQLLQGREGMLATNANSLQYNGSR